jgi:hypothetical protein
MSPPKLLGIGTSNILLAAVFATKLNFGKYRNAASNFSLRPVGAKEIEVTAESAKIASSRLKNSPPRRGNSQQRARAATPPPR